MIVRMWRGSVKPEDAEEYAKYVDATGFSAYGETPGNRGAYMLRRERDGLVEFTTVSMWDDMEAVKAFAGEDPGRAVYYPEDDRFLVERVDRVDHHEVVRTVNV